MIRKLKIIARILATPSCWIRNYETCKIWDARVNSLLDNEDFEISEGGYTIYFPKSSISVWVSNFPYCFGSFYGKGIHGKSIYGAHVSPSLPTRATVFRLYDMILEKARKEFIEEISQ